MSEKTEVYQRAKIDCPESALESQFIEEYLRTKGVRWEEVKTLPEAEAIRLMKEACRYAALKLAEIEARSKFSRKIAAPD